MFCRANRPRLNLSLRRRTRLTRGACNNCEFLFEAGNCSWHTQFLTSFLLFFTASALSQSMTYLNSPLFAQPTNRWKGGGQHLLYVHSETALTREPRGLELEHLRACKVWKKATELHNTELFFLDEVWGLKRGVVSTTESTAARSISDRHCGKAP